MDAARIERDQSFSPFSQPTKITAKPMKKHNHVVAFAIIFPGVLLLGSHASAQTRPSATTTEPVVELERFIAEETVEDPAGVLPTSPISSVFGGSRTILETPRSVSTVSTEMLEQFGIDNVEGLAALVPNSYTASSFGIAGSLDIRGTSGENYFRGMKRIENGGVYPTPIGATDRVDIVRGPPSAVFGPGKIGGYLNFIPKSSRASTGKYLEGSTGKTSVTYGSHSKKLATIEQGGPITFTDRNAGYYVYVLMEDSNSYYRNAGQEQFLVQSSFDIQINNTWRTEFGQQYHKWSSIELSGINRLTQNYINNGTYTSGAYTVNLDTNGDGMISPAEFTAGGGVSRSFPWGTSAAAVTAALPASWALNPSTIQTVNLPGSAILSDLGDYANAISSLVFFDLINDSNSTLKYKNQVLVDTLRRTKDTSQGFATKADGFQLENKFTVEHAFTPAEWIKMNNSGALSYKYFDGENRSYTAFQPFNRRDLYVGATPNTRIVSANDYPGVAPWTANRQSEHTTFGVGVLTDTTIFEKLNVILGARNDWMDLESSADPNSTSDGAATSAAKTTGVTNSVDAFSYSASVSYTITPSVIPYFTHSKQQSLQIGNIGDVIPGNVPTPITPSTLDEVGIKSSLLQGKLFSGVAAYRQERESIDPLNFESFSTRAQGIEFEFRYVPNRKWSISGAASWQKTIYLRAPTSFGVPAEFFGVDPTLAYGGSLTVTNIPSSAGYQERGGYPDKVFSLYSTYSFTKNLSVSLGALYQAEMSSGSAKTFILPDVLKFDGSISYAFGKWDVRVRMNNITDERYFQANSPDNIGNTVALPKLPRTTEVVASFKF